MTATELARRQDEFLSGGLQKYTKSLLDLFDLHADSGEPLTADAILRHQDEFLKSIKKTS